MQASTNGKGGHAEEEEDTGVRLPDLSGLTLSTSDLVQAHLGRLTKQQEDVTRGKGIDIPTTAAGNVPTGPRSSTTPSTSPGNVASPRQPTPSIVRGGPSRTAQGIVSGGPSRTSQGIAIGTSLKSPTSTPAPGVVASPPTAPKQTELYVSPELQAARAAGFANAVQAIDSLASRTAPATPTAPAAAKAAAAPANTAEVADLRRRKLRCVQEVQRIKALIEKLSARDEELKRKAQTVVAEAPADASSDEVLGRQLRAMWEETRGSEQVAITRALLVEKVHKAVTHRWNGHGLIVAPFGSSITGLAGADSDVDLVLLDPMRPLGVGTPPHLRQPSQSRNVKIGPDGLPDYYSVWALGTCLHNAGFVDVSTVAHASVPIVKFTDGKSGLQLDLNVNDRFGLANSALLRAYAELRPSLVRPLMYAVKTWAKRRALNDPAGADGSASFSSYALALMVIQYLQLNGDLPNLQSPELLAHLKVNKVRLFKDIRNKNRNRREPRKRSAAAQVQAPADEIPYDCTFAELTEPNAHAQYKLDSEDPRERDAALGRAWNGFAQWLKALDGKIVSVAKGELMERRRPTQQQLRNGKKIDIYAEQQDDAASAPAKEELDEEEEEEEEEDRVVTLDNFVEPKNWHQRPFIVQDPFILDRNCTGSVLSGILTNRLAPELKRIVQLSNSPHGTFSDLMQDVRFSGAQVYLKDLQREQTALEALKLDVNVNVAKKQLQKIKAAQHADYLRASMQTNRGGVPLNIRTTLPPRPGGMGRRGQSNAPQQQQQQQQRGTTTGGFRGGHMPMHAPRTQQMMYAPVMGGFHTQAQPMAAPMPQHVPYMAMPMHAPSPPQQQQQQQEQWRGGGGAPEGNWRGGRAGGGGRGGARGGGSYRGARRAAPG